MHYPNVNRDNLNIKSTTDGRFGFGGSSRTSVISAVGKLLGQLPDPISGAFQDFLQDTGKEPYIVSNIGDGGRLINLLLETISFCACLKCLPRPIN